jgi:hypothetical protein
LKEIKLEPGTPRAHAQQDAQMQPAAASAAASAAAAVARDEQLWAEAGSVGLQALPARAILVQRANEEWDRVRLQHTAERADLQRKHQAAVESVAAAEPARGWHWQVWQSSTRRTG